MLSASQPARNFTAPCVSMISVWKLRPLRGMSSTKMRSIKVLTVPDWAHNSELGRYSLEFGCRSCGFDSFMRLANRA